MSYRKTVKQEPDPNDWGRIWEETDKAMIKACREINARRREIDALPTEEERDRLIEEIMEKYR